jgi:hypothetical protein
MLFTIKLETGHPYPLPVPGRSPPHFRTLSAWFVLAVQPFGDFLSVGWVYTRQTAV